MVGERRSAMDTETSDVIARINARIDALEASLRAEFRSGLTEGLAQHRRHAEVLIESVRDDIRMLAEGFRDEHEARLAPTVIHAPGCVVRVRSKAAWVTIL
jgi:hypothetical protein